MSFGGFHCSFMAFGVVSVASRGPCGADGLSEHKTCAQFTYCLRTSAQFTYCLRTTRYIRSYIPLKIQANSSHALIRSGTDLISLLILLLLLFFFLLWRPHQKSLRLCHFKSDQDEIWQDCFSTKYTLIDGIGFLIIPGMLYYNVILSRWQL